ncbi:hypothetical protein BDV59DRAFT_187899 [Aspergillus ambiguus]|uniref:uncharacterized protein n=1 Tax=Aspergillus ambiguus TaxID=176160 RepID=UPI003CCDD0C2
MAAQHGSENIRANCVCPGMVFTPMMRGRSMTGDAPGTYQPAPHENRGDCLRCRLWDDIYISL